MATGVSNRSPVAGGRASPVGFRPVAFIPTCRSENRGGAPSSPRWVHEIKYDGFRSQAHIHDGAVTIFSSGEHDWTDRYRTVAEEAAKLNVGHLVLDGEMVVLRSDGTCDFWALQQDVRAANSERL